MSWKTEVKVDGDKEWYSNTLRFATRVEAVLYGEDIFRRWALVIETQAVETNDPVRHTFYDGKVKEL